MMIGNKDNTILIAYSSNFKQDKLFKRKVNNLTRNLDTFDVVSLNDANKYIEDYFKGEILGKYDFNSLGNAGLKKLLKTVSHVIVFWDGTDLVDLIYLSLFLKLNTRIIPVETTRVVNKDKKQKFDVYIGRGSPWGNPFAIGDNGMSREEVIEKYKNYFQEEILSDDQRRKDLLSLKGQVLGCHCKPLACHGDVIADYLNSLDEELPF